MKMKTITAGALILLSAISTTAQNHTPGQNYMNKFTEAPAYAGFNGNAEGFLGYRAMMTGIDGAPKILRANFNGNIKGQMGYGVDVINEKAGNFNNTILALSYAYHVQLGGEANLSFAITPTLLRSAFDLASAKTFGAAADPVFQNQAGLSGTGFDAGFSVMFNIKGLYFSVNAPRLICKDLQFQNGIVDADRIINGSISYAIEADKWEIEPMAQVDYAMIGGIEWAGGLALKYNQRAWLQGSYSSENWIGIGVGFAASNRIALCYQYEIGTSDIAKTCNGNHELTAGFLISKAKKRKNPTIFAEDEKTDPKSDSKYNAKPDSDLAKKLEEEIKNRDNEIKRLEGLIDDCCTNNTPSSDVNSPKPSDDGPKPVVDPNEPDQETVINTEPTPEYDEVAQPRDPQKVKWLESRELINVRFATNTTRLLESSKSDLDAFANIVAHNFNADRDILIISYTNDMTDYGKQIANTRSMEIKKYLVAKGIQSKRIITSVKRLRNVSDTPEGRYEDSRITVSLEAKPRDK